MHTVGFHSIQEVGAPEKTKKTRKETLSRRIIEAPLPLYLLSSCSSRVFIVHGEPGNWAVGTPSSMSLEKALAKLTKENGKVQSGISGTRSLVEQPEEERARGKGGATYSSKNLSWLSA